jgi:chemotaxis signal transduction protein
VKNIQGVVKLDNGILLIIDLEKMLSLDAEVMLDNAIQNIGANKKSVQKKKVVLKNKKLSER